VRSQDHSNIRIFKDFGEPNLQGLFKDFGEPNLQGLVNTRINL